MSIDVNKIREDFPSLREKINGRPPVYFDNACVTLRPKQVVRALQEYYFRFPGCHRRTDHAFGRKTSEEFLLARKKIKKFINAKSEEEIVFVRNATEAINFVANSFPLKKGEVVLTSELEHNSNFLPWQELGRRRGFFHKTIPLTGDLAFDAEAFKKMIDAKVRLVSVFHTSNVTGYTLPASELIKIAHSKGAAVLLDGAQSVGHKKIDVQELDADFFVFSFHKILGPSGMGVCYGKKSYLERMPQFLLGGESILDARNDNFVPAELPAKFEAGLQDYAGAIAAGAAVEYLERIGQKNIETRDRLLNKMLTERILHFPGITILGPQSSEQRGNIVNFIVRDFDSLAIAGLLNETGNIMVRAGKHCAHPWFNSSGTPASVRASTYFYNTEEEVDLFTEILGKIIRHFQ